MTKQMLAAAAVSLALSLSLAGSALADVGDDIREDIRDDIEVLTNQELADRPEIDCDPRVCGNPPDFVNVEESNDNWWADLPGERWTNIEQIPNIRFRVPLP